MKDFMTCCKFRGNLTKELTKILIQATFDASGLEEDLCNLPMDFVSQAGV